MARAKLNKAQREERDQKLLGALTDSWMPADSVLRDAYGGFGIDRPVDAQGAGQVLSRLAREEKCEAKIMGYYSVYRKKAVG